MNTLPISSAPIVIRAALLPAHRVTIHGAQANALAVELAAQAVGENRAVVFLSSDNRFDPYAVARYARSHGWSETAVLQRILIARAFMAYQLAELLGRLKPEDIAGPVTVSGICTPSLTKTFRTPKPRACSIARSGARSNFRNAA